MIKGKRKILTGRVIGDKMDKTVVVAITWQQTHRIYRKSVRRITKTYAHDERNTCRLGDLVQIEEARPLSRIKRWRVVNVLSQQDLPESPPSAVDEIIHDLETSSDPEANTLEGSIDSTTDVDTAQEEEPSSDLSEKTVDSVDVDAAQEEEPSSDLSEKTVDSVDVDAAQEEEPSSDFSEKTVDSVDVDAAQEEEPSSDLIEETVDSVDVDATQEEEPSSDLIEETVDLQDDSPSDKDEVSK